MPNWSTKSPPFSRRRTPPIGCQFSSPSTSFTQHHPPVSLSFFNYTKKNMGFKPDLKTQWKEKFEINDNKYFYSFLDVLCEEKCGKPQNRNGTGECKNNGGGGTGIFLSGINDA
nr:pentatricopeptide repeat-containing protein At4g21170 [Ipomoea batatas]